MRLADIPARGRIRVAKKTVMPGATVFAIASFFSPTDVERAHGVCVVAGPGSFSAIRGGVLIANLLARLHDKKLYGLSKDEASDLTAVRERLTDGQLPSAPYVAPVYDAEPNITC